MESPKYNMTIRLSHHATARRKEKVESVLDFRKESTLGFRENLKNLRIGGGNIREKFARLVRVLLVISHLGL